MKTVVYANKENTVDRDLIHMIQTRLTGIEIITTHSLVDLSQMLRQPLHSLAVIVLVIESKKELDALNQMIPLFDNSRIIAVLPDRGKTILSLCLQLRPSFFSYCDTDLTDIVSVLEKIQKNSKEMKHNG
jgi:hypothetical protein